MKAARVRAAKDRRILKNSYSLDDKEEGDAPDYFGLNLFVDGAITFDLPLALFVASL